MRNLLPIRHERGGRYGRVYVALVLAVLLYCPLLFATLDHYGRRDWDQFSFRYETPRTALLRDHQLPLWNPYVNGGTVLLAHPDSPFPSPWYLPVLALGAPLGLRVQAVLFMAIGAVGMAALLRRWGAPAPGCFIGGVIFMMSAHFSLHIAEGHLEWCVLGLMPWVVLSLLRSATNPRFVVGAALLLASALLFGSVYIVAVYLPFLSLWAGLESVRRRSWRLATNWTLVVLLMALFSAVKLMPQLEFTESNPRPQKVVTAGLSLAGLVPMFADRRQDEFYRAMRDVESVTQRGARGLGDASGTTLADESARSTHARLRALGVTDEWHEYGAYVTILGLVCAFTGLFAGWRTQWPLYVAGGFALATVMSAGLPIDFWALLQRLPFYSSLTVPSRFLAAVVFVMATAAGLGLGWLCTHAARRGTAVRVIVCYLIPLVIYAELAVVGWRLFGDVFVYPQAPLPRHESFATRYRRIDTNYPGMYSYTYPLLAANSGVIEGYENVHVARGAVRVEGEAGYRGEVYLDSSSAPVAVSSWTMGRVEVEFPPVDAPDHVILNQNYFNGWRAEVQGGGGRRAQVAAPSGDGLVAVAVYPGDRAIEIYYLPQSFVTGSWISGLSLGLAMLALAVVPRRYSADAPDVAAAP